MVLQYLILDKASSFWCYKSLVSLIPKNVVFPGTLATWIWLSTDLLLTVHPAASDRTGHETSGKYFLIIFSCALDSSPILNNAWQMEKETSTAYKSAVTFLCILNSIVMFFKLYFWSRRALECLILLYFLVIGP